MNDSKVLFTFLIKPYLDNTTLARLSLTCRVMREYVTKDLVNHWHIEYLKLNKKDISVESLSRKGPCIGRCFNRDINYYTSTMYREDQVREITDEKTYIKYHRYYKDIKFSTLTTDEQKTLLSYFPTKKRHAYGEHSYQEKNICNYHYELKYKDDLENKVGKTTRIDYYNKVIYHDIHMLSKQTLANQIRAKQNIYNTLKEQADRMEVSLNKLKHKMEIKESVMRQPKAKTLPPTQNNTSDTPDTTPSKKIILVKRIE